MPGDSAQVVINQIATKGTGLCFLKMPLGNNSTRRACPQLTICGVVQPIFSSAPCRAAIQPYDLRKRKLQSVLPFFSIRLKPGNMEASWTALQKKWAEVMPGAPFEYSFMDDALAKMYKTELQLKKASYLATGLAIIIVLLGY
jgi:putative ABC transport system permease protein